MELSSKAIRFVVEAIEYRIEWYEHELRREDLTEDGLSDLMNDLYYFKAILSDLKGKHQPLEAPQADTA